MKFLFIENRGKTAFWQPIALELQKRGHDIAWLVQNPQYVPGAFAADPSLHILPFPPDASGSPTRESESWVAANFPALVTDRGRSYFGAGTAHYAHYSAEIARVLAHERPDIVVGEATLFHELIAISCCRELGIAYVYPCANRYPDGRFSMLSFETQHAAGGSGEEWTAEDASDLASRIATGREIPFYMRAPSRFERLNRKVGQVRAHALVWWGHLRGERYNTPALRQKLSLNRTLASNLQAWQLLQKIPAQGARALLYPLQMQPESNIDVWGRPYSNQIEMVRAMLADAPADVQVAVKANPKSKYEVSAGLIALAAQDARVCLLPLTMRMGEAQALTIGTLTVSGTVGYEAVLGKGRCLSLRHPVIEQNFPSHHARSVADGVQRLLNEPLAGVGGIEFGTRLIQSLVRDSFPGLVSEPLYHPACIDADNVRLVADVLHRFVSNAASVTRKL